MKKTILFYNQSIFEIPLNNIILKKFKKLSVNFDIWIFAQNKDRFFLKFNNIASFFLLKRFNNFFLRHFFFILLSFFYLPLIIKKNKIKNIVFQSGYDFLVILLIKIMFRNKINIILEFHGDMFSGMKHYNSFFIKNYIAYLFVKLSEKIADKKRAVSQIALKNADIIFPPYMDLEYFVRPISIKREKIIFFAGMLEKIKNIDYLITEFYKFQSEFPDYTLNIAGTGSELKNIENMVKKLNISHKVNFLGVLKRESLKYEYYRSEIFVLPSLSEGFGRVACEASVCGCKVLVSENCGVKTYFNHNNIFNKTGLYQKIVDNIKDTNNIENKKIYSLLGDTEFFEGMKLIAVE
ncbi:MAG: glycosyltransferase [Candidatus Muirbacterium halophilum]|nr:glycosyltransferase [Candidatus Muirbacterium halophilum]MCK9477226.1 glycosyltransferase [Candidatus Muirbacterium halophilum]